MKGYKRFHGYAQCDKEGCDWDSSAPAKLLGKEAQAHADETGHSVLVNICLYKRYAKEG